MIKSLLIKPYAAYCKWKVDQIRRNAHVDQDRIFKQLIYQGRNTTFGQEHNLKDVNTHREFISAVSIRDYEALKEYFDAVALGEKDILWPGTPIYLTKTSGTTSGVKYIPITKDSLPNHIDSARLALLNYASDGSKSRLFDGKVMFLSGSPALVKKGGIPTGRLSGIVNHEIPAWIRGNQLPSYQTNCIDDWENKVDRIVEETVSEDLRLISGIPPWVQMYFDRILSKTGKKSILEVFPNLRLFIYGGVNYDPYKTAMESVIGHQIDSLETYPASEGFIAFQDEQKKEGLLLNTSSGIFFEFIPTSEIFSDHPTRLTIKDVKIGIDYAIILNNNAGLWGYNLGDTVKFVKLNPYRLVVTGRIKHFVSAFGEHVISQEVEKALDLACRSSKMAIREFTVAPQVNPPDGGLPFHEWFVEFEHLPDNLSEFGRRVDACLCEQNAYYNDLISGNILKTLVIVPLKTESFRILMKSLGKLGGQNKVPRLSNDRKIADILIRKELTLPIQKTV